MPKKEEEENASLTSADIGFALISILLRSAGNGSASHLAMELLRTTVGGLNLLHVPYRGMGPAVLEPATYDF